METEGSFLTTMQRKTNSILCFLRTGILSQEKQWKRRYVRAREMDREAEGREGREERRRGCEGVDKLLGSCYSTVILSWLICCKSFIGLVPRHWPTIQQILYTYSYVFPPFSFSPLLFPAAFTHLLQRMDVCK